jgi:hypothetical protein
MGIVIPGLIVTCITKPNIVRDWVRIITCQHRRGDTEPVIDDEEATV